ncbi:MAG: DNA polymerase III subunit gamma/tau [Thermosynechococcaceae cyanobacterium]
MVRAVALPSVCPSDNLALGSNASLIFLLGGKCVASYEPLHHKYRPQIFADLVGQDAIATTLSSAIRLQRIAPAYLFTGPRGTGKTSSARILAKSLNCIAQPVPTPTPCGVCEVCQAITLGNALDVIEIDAASNTGVDNIRDLIERAQFAPVQCRYKIYCLDEVHMLSTAAFNALLKTLEEPPDRVVFILATTDAQRVLPTIISRCQRFDFRRIPLQAMTDHLAKIAEIEQIPIDRRAVELVAQMAQGGLRDAESLLDQLSLLAGEITVESIWDLAGTVPEQDLLALSRAIAAAHPETILDCTRQLLDRGREPLIVLQNLASFYRDLLIAKTAPNRRDLTALTELTWSALCEFAQTLEVNTILAGQHHLRTSEAQIKNTTQPRLWLEVSLLGLIPRKTDPVPTPAMVAPLPVAPPQPSVQPPVADVRPTDSQPPQALRSPDAELAPANGATANGSMPSVSTQPLEPLAVKDPGLQPSESAQPQPVEPAAPDISAMPTDLDLAQLWQQLLTHLNRPSQALLSQHGQLLFFQGREARIGIRNGSLARIAQNKIPDVEAAFLKVFNRKVSVSLSIMAADAPTSAPGPPPPVELPPSSESPPVSFRAVSANPEAPKTPTAIAPVVPQSETSAPAIAPRPIPNGTDPRPAIAPTGETGSPLTANPAWETYDELSQAARNFAQFFNGSLVNLGGLEVQEDAETHVIPPPRVDGPDWEEAEADEF